MKTALIALLALPALAGCAETFGTYRSEETYGDFKSPNVHIAQAWLLGAPAYPKAEFAKGNSGYVVMDARVTPQGELVDVQMAPGTGPQTFVDAVREAIPMWRFYPPLDQNCQSTDQRIKVRTWFDVEGGQPKIVVQGEGPTWSADNQPQPITTVKPLYPRKISSFRWTDGVVVFAKATVEPDGTVKSTTAKAYPRKLPWLMDSFEDATRTAVLNFKFPPAPAGSMAKRYYCTDAVFASE